MRWLIDAQRGILTTTPSTSDSARESGHWYDDDAKLVTAVPYATPRKGTHSPTLRDAKKYKLRPSVTTILQLLDKPALHTWAVKHAVEASLKAKRKDDEEDVELVKRIIKYHEEHAKGLAAFGTQVHYGISEGLSGKKAKLDPAPTGIVKEFWKWYNDSGFKVEKSEHTFVSPLGYAGTIDFLGTLDGEPVIADFKTQDHTEEKDAKFYDEYALQLAGYAIGTNNMERRRFSLVVSRTTPGLVTVHEWNNSVKWDRTFGYLWQLWKLLRDYDPLA